MKSITFTHAMHNAEHLRALGLTKIHLDEHDYFEWCPWSLVTRVEPEPVLKGGICFRLEFTADVQPEGLTFWWTVDVASLNRTAPRDAFYNAELLERIGVKLSPKGRSDLTWLLDLMGQRIEEIAMESEKIAQSRRREAQEIRNLLVGVQP